MCKLRGCRGRVGCSEMEDSTMKRLAGLYRDKVCLVNGGLGYFLGLTQIAMKP